MSEVKFGIYCITQSWRGKGATNCMMHFCTTFFMRWFVFFFQLKQWHCWYCWHRWPLWLCNLLLLFFVYLCMLDYVQMTPPFHRRSNLISFIIYIKLFINYLFHVTGQEPPNNMCKHPQMQIRRRAIDFSLVPNGVFLFINHQFCQMNVIDASKSCSSNLVAYKLVVW